MDFIENLGFILFRIYVFSSEGLWNNRLVQYDPKVNFSVEPLMYIFPLKHFFLKSMFYNVLMNVYLIYF